VQNPTPPVTVQPPDEGSRMRRTYASVILVELAVLSALWIFQEYFSR
jgi:hypothetical protein